MKPGSTFVVTVIGMVILVLAVFLLASFIGAPDPNAGRWEPSPRGEVWCVGDPDEPDCDWDHTRGAAR